MIVYFSVNGNIKLEKKNQERNNFGNQWVRKKARSDKGGDRIPIFCKIYMATMELGITRNISVRNIHNLVGDWMNVDPRMLSITICCVGEYRDGMRIEF
jgi:hypothetical protein